MVKINLFQPRKFTVIIHMSLIKRIALTGGCFRMNIFMLFLIKSDFRNCHPGPKVFLVAARFLIHISANILG